MLAKPNQIKRLPRITPEVRQTVLAASKRGLGYKTITHMTGLSKDSIFQIRKKDGIVRPKAKGPRQWKTWTMNMEPNHSRMLQDFINKRNQTVIMPVSHHLREMILYAMEWMDQT